MDKKIRIISKELALQIGEVANGIHSVGDFWNGSEQITDLLFNYFPQIKYKAMESFRVVDKNNNVDKFVEENESRRKIWAMSLFRSMEHYYNQYKSIDCDFLKMLLKIIDEELQYFYKNVQMIIVTDNKLDYNFVAHKSACKVCQFLVNNNNIEVLKKHFMKDDCDSYLVRPVDFFNNSNLISNDLKLYNVPTMYKKSIATFYNIVKIKFHKVIKMGVKIKFVDCFEMENVNKEVLDMLRVVEDEEKSEYYIKFSLDNYRHDLLSVILNLKDAPDKVKELYYSKTSKDVIFPNDRFITFLAEQNADSYYKESCIAYILEPEKLKNVDNKIFEYFQEQFERR